MYKQTTDEAPIFQLLNEKSKYDSGRRVDKRYAGDSRGRKANKMEAHD